MATANPTKGDPTDGGEDDYGSDREEQTLTYEQCRRAVIKYPSNNAALDREFQTAYPSTTLATFSTLIREDKIDAVVKARLLLNVGNHPVLVSVENLGEGRDTEEFDSPMGNTGQERERDRAHGRGAEPPLAQPPADASLAQILLFMQQQQQHAQTQQQIQLATTQQQMQAQKAASDRQIQLLADQLEATRRSTDTNNNKFDVRLKRAKELLSGVLGRMPDDGRSVVKYFETAERFFTLYSIDDDLKCPILNSLLSDKAKQLLHRIPIDAIKTFDACGQICCESLK